MDGMKQIQALPMEEERKPLLKDLNNFLMCRLCGGYLVEATSLVECLHTYCRSCIVQYVQLNKSCPICEISVTNKMKPCLSLRPDKIVQRLVYKTVPGLYKNELERRRQYLLTSNNDEKMAVNHEDFQNDEYYFSPEEPISISLEYIEENKTTITQISSTDTIVNDSDVKLTNVDEEIVQITHKRYLQCPAAVKIAHINKLIKMKYSLQSNHEVEILYKNVKLPNYFSLMDTAYMFSWNREKPMRLCYQILERCFIQVPVVISNKILDDFAPSLKNSNCVKHSVSSNMNLTPDPGMPNNVKQDNNETDSSASKNFKRKADSTIKLQNETEISDDQFEFREPSLKIPRIESNGLAEVKVEKEGVTDCNVSKSPSSKMEEDAVLPKSVDSSLKTGSFSTSENITDYEQDIEEVDEEDDDGDDEGRLLISQLSDEEILDNKPDDSGPLVIDVSDSEKVQDDRYEDKKVKYKRKNKKSKHHHHRKHRHHERKKNATQATILHSPDADSGIILKLKLSNHTSLETKHHKQSKRKHKKNSDTYFSSFSSSSSVSSLTISSPEPHSISRADEDSLHSQISECSADNAAEANSSNKELPKTDMCSTSSIPVTKAVVAPIAEKEVDNTQKLPAIITDKSSIVRNLQIKNEVSHSSPPNKITSELKSSSSKEKLTQIRNFRPKNIAIVRPEEHSNENSTKNDNNNNDQSAPVLSKVEEEKSESSITDIQKSASPSGLTVSKMTAAEIKMEQEKLQLFNGSKEEPPALEITVVSSNKGLASVPSPKLNESAGVTIRPNKSMQKPIKPIPAAIPLSQYQKMKSSEQYTSSSSLSKLTEHNLPKSLTITPHMVTNTHRNLKANSDVPNKKIRSTSDLKTDGIKQSVTISLSENDSALDLSGVTKQQIIHSQSKKILAAGTQSVRMNVVPMHYSSHLSNKPTSDGAVYPIQKFPELLTSNRTNGLQYPPASLSVTSTSSPSPKSMKITTSFAPTILKSQVPIRSNTVKMNHRNEEEWGRKVNGMPQLNEIRKGPPSKPGPNQNVRSIPNLSTILQRQQPISNFNATPPDVAMMHRMMSSVCSLGNLKKTLEKCPPAVPINNAYIDRTNLMITK